MPNKRSFGIELSWIKSFQDIATVAIFEANAGSARPAVHFIDAIVLADGASGPALTVIAAWCR